MVALKSDLTLRQHLFNDPSDISVSTGKCYISRYVYTHLPNLNKNLFEFS